MGNRRIGAPSGDEREDKAAFFIFDESRQQQAKTTCETKASSITAKTVTRCCVLTPSDNKRRNRTSGEKDKNEKKSDNKKYNVTRRHDGNTPTSYFLNLELSR